MRLAAHFRLRFRDFLLFVAAGLLPVPWMLAHHFSGLDLMPSLVATLAGTAILGGALLLTWATELSERDVPQGIAILVLALVSVLPEYAVDLHFAWTAGRDPSYAPFAVANMTGANRLLIGLGWAAVVVVACWRQQTSELVIHRRQSLEMRFLLYATLYSFLIPLTGTINLFDALVLFAIFGFYARAAMGSESDEVELVGPPAMVDRDFGSTGRRVWALGLFVFAAYGIFISAEPFADSLVEIGRASRMDEFLLVQWVAPLASESPEFLVAILFAWKLRGSIGIGALISSKVNQWTLLVGAIPIAYAVSAGAFRGLPLDARQTEELILTSTQSLLAAVLIIDLRFSRKDALFLAVLFLAQFLFPTTHARYFFILLYLAVTLGLLTIRGAGRRARLLALLLPQAGRGEQPIQTDER
jgi:cation:H+ antiporter